MDSALSLGPIVIGLDALCEIICVSTEHIRSLYGREDPICTEESLDFVMLDCTGVQSTLYIVLVQQYRRTDMYTLYIVLEYCRRYMTYQIVAVYSTGMLLRYRIVEGHRRGQCT